VEDTVGIVHLFIRKAPGGGNRGVNYEIRHLRTAMIDVVTDCPAFGVGLNTFLNFQNSSGSGLCLLTAGMNILHLGLLARECLHPGFNSQAMSQGLLLQQRHAFVGQFNGLTHLGILLSPRIK
jgi:hypothetical protein